MQRPSADEYSKNYQPYFDLVPAGDYLELLSRNTTELMSFLGRLPAEKHDYKYADDKWTTKQVVMHIIDTERVFAYRGLVAARGDTITVQHRMDEQLYASNVDVSGRSVDSLIFEFNAVRRATETLFENLSDAESQRWCNIGTHPMTARAIAYFMIGHVLHHLHVIEERYL
jgi:uncharacterized damage-inducible protein DinB